MPAEYDQILRDVIQRDEQDSTRASAPLRQAEDAVLIDTTNIGFEETVALMKKMMLETAQRLSLTI